ncbi:MAG: tRNA (adenosine(37)-N6)-threonylcarbamoyltransferase complex ATPase subunit type 1 TsaE [Candidatus Yanofskybacteria bacterium]|nr:tRNA (adenosine(37)-N6)-threonylcarbamoyltransferase complex ATPase subunit type 1 TsaE [Candidatus Yanofskybacteria bacterium]
MVYYSKSEKETQKIASDLAIKTIKSSTSPSQTRLRRANVVTLEGELGAGKTTFVKGFAKALGIKTKIKSPTFVLMKYYPITYYVLRIKKSIRNPQSVVRKLYHLDCYRVRDHRDLTTLNLKTMFNSSENIILIEWPERIKKILPKKLIRVHIDHINKNKRKISISPRA